MRTVADQFAEPLAEGTMLSMVKALISGCTHEVIDLTRTNVWC
jgi:hypothetical protein